MPYKLECAQSFSSSDATEADIHKAFDDDRIRGEFIILEAPNGDFLQAAGEEDGPYLLEHRTATGEHERADGEHTRETVRAAFISFRRGDNEWRTAHQWNPLEQRTGCMPMLMIGMTAIASIVGLGVP